MIWYITNTAANHASFLRPSSFLLLLCFVLLNIILYVHLLCIYQGRSKGETTFQCALNRFSRSRSRKAFKSLTIIIVIRNIHNKIPSSFSAGSVEGLHYETRRSSLSSSSRPFIIHHVCGLVRTISSISSSAALSVSELMGAVVRGVISNVLNSMILHYLNTRTDISTAHPLPW